MQVDTMKHFKLKYTMHVAGMKQFKFKFTVHMVHGVTVNKSKAK